MKPKTFKKVLSASLALLMLAPMTAAAQSADVLSLTASAVGSATVVDSGLCGDTATYTLDNNGVLTISGTGGIYANAFKSGSYAKASSITSLTFANGSAITEIGESAFEGCTALAAVSCTAEDLTVKEGAFTDTSALTTLTLSGGSLTLFPAAFAVTGVRNITIGSTSVNVHPNAFSGSEQIETLTFNALDGTTIQGIVEELPETAQVTVSPFSKIYTPAGKYFTGPSVAYDTYQPQYDEAQLYWGDTDAVVAAAEADEAGVSIRDRKETLEWITNDNVSTLFPGAQATIIGTMEGDGSFANPYLIYNPQNWRYLDYLGRTGKLSSSYYGWDRGTNVKLMADLTLSDRDGTFTTLGGGKHREVHNSGYAYAGNFDGNGHTITLDVNESIDDGTTGFGLIEKTDGAYIKNLHISGRMVSSQQYTGLLVGYIASDHIYNCSSDAELVLSGTGEMKSGALVGYAYKPYIENCHFTGKILGGNGITAVGGFVGELSSSSGGSTLKNCYFAPSQISVSSEGSCILYRPYYGSYAGWCGFEEIENNYYNAEALKLNGDNMGGLDQGASDAEGIDSLNETEFWDNGQLTMSKATASANPGTRRFAYTGGEHRIFMDLQADGYNGGGSILARGSSFPYMPGYANNGIAYYKVNDGDWSATPPLATEVGEYTVYYRVAGDPYHRDSDIQSIQVTIEDGQTLPGSGTPADPYTISNDLEWSIFCDMRDTDGKYFKLVNDIVVSEDRQSKRGPNHPLEFNGFFDGDGHTITLYYVSRGTSDSLFGKLIGIWSYDTSSYKPVCIKNLTVDGVMYGSSGENSPIAYEITHNATVSNVINNMTIVHMGAGGDRSVSGIVNTGSLSGGAHFYNCKVSGKFSAMNGNKTFAGLTNMNDFWQSGTDFIIKDCYVNPTCEDIKVSASNYVIVGNYKEEIVTIENTFFGQSILSIIPVDEETGETTNTQGISDENGLDALDATGYWANGIPTMPKAVFSTEATACGLVYDEQEHELVTAAESEQGTVYYRLEDGAWSADIPTATEIGTYTVHTKVAGDFLHRDSDIKAIEVVINKPLENHSTLSCDVVVLGDSININGATEGGLGVKRYTVNYKHQDSDTWTRYRTNVTKTEIPFAPDQLGTYELRVIAKDEQNTQVPKTLTLNVLPVLENTSVISADNVKLGKSVTVTAASTGGLGDKQYEVSYQAPDGGAWTTVQEYSAKTSVAVKPTVKGENTVRVNVKDERGRVVEAKDFALTVYDTVKNTSVVSAETCKLGAGVTVTCSSEDGLREKQYQVRIQDLSDESWKTVRGYSTDPTIPVNPAKVGSYTVRVYVKDESGDVAKTDFPLTVYETVKNTSTVSDTSVQVKNTLTVTCSSEDGLGEKQYQVSVYNPVKDKWMTALSYGAGTETTITPSNTGNYIIRVNVRDASGEVVSQEFPVIVFAALNNTSTVAADEIKLSDPVSITCSSTGGLGTIRYELWYYTADTDTWKKFRSYSTEASASFTPDQTGEYTVRVKAKDEKGNVVRKDIAVNVFKLLNTSTIAAETVLLGKTVTVTCSSDGGLGSKQYEVLFRSMDENGWTTAQAYSTKTSVAVKPAKKGDCVIRVNAKDESGDIVGKEFTVLVYSNLKNTSTLSAEAVQLGGSITVNGSSEEGLGEVQYGVWYKSPSTGSWYKAHDYGTDTTLSFKPKYLGDYVLRVKAKDESGTIVSKDLDLKVFAELENTSVISVDTLEKGDSVTVTCSSEGGLGEKQYGVWYQSPTNGNWYKAQDYSTETTATVTPKNLGTYIVRVKVKDERGKIVNKDFPVLVFATLKNKSSISVKSLKSGGSVTVTAAATGGLGETQFAVWYQSPYNDKWYRAQDYSTNTTVDIKPNHTGEYVIRVKAKDERGVIVDNDMPLTVFDELKNTSTISTNTVKPGGTVTITASSTGGLGEVTYQMWYKDAAGTWTKVQAYSTNTTADVVFENVGVYTVRIKAKDKSGDVFDSDHELKVYSPIKNTSTLSDTSVMQNRPITVNCSAEDGLGTKEFEVTYYSPSTQKWYTAKEFGTAATAEIKPNHTGTYTVRIIARDETGETSTVEKTFTSYATLKNTSTISTTTLLLSESLTVTCSSTGGSGTKQYKVTYYSPQSQKWYTAKSYSTSTTATIKPNYTGNYIVRTYVKDGKGNEVTKEMTVNVYGVLKNTSTVSATTIKNGSSVTVNCSSTGGLGQIKYKVTVYNPKMKTWSTAQDYSTNANVSVKFSGGYYATFTVRVEAKDTRNIIVSKDLSVKVTQ